jgi:hypothetical protein
MSSLLFLIEDDRYSVPTLRIVDVETIFSARIAAERVLRSSPHHLGVEVWREDERLFVIGAAAASHHDPPVPHRLS